MKYFLILFSFFSTTASAQTVSATADRQKILIGEPFYLQLQAVFTNKQNPVFFKADSFPHFEIMERSGIDTVRNGDRILLTENFKMTSWDSGVWQIPALSINKVKTAPVKIDVAFSPSPFDVNQPYHDIRDIIEVKKPIASNWYWYLLFLIVLIGLFLLFFPPGKKPVKKEFRPDVSAYSIALRKLQELENAASADQKQFFTQLIHIYREYLYRRKNIQSFSKTTDDLAIQMDRLDLPDEEYRKTLQALRMTDMVKYAKYHPSTEESRIAVETIRDSIMTIERLPNVV